MSDGLIISDVSQDIWNNKNHLNIFVSTEGANISFSINEAGRSAVK